MSELERRVMTALSNAEGQVLTEEQLREKYGQLWSTQQLTADFDVHGFGAPFVSVTRKVDGVKGSLMFIHSPRWYHSFMEA